MESLGKKGTGQTLHDYIPNPQCDLVRTGQVASVNLKTHTKTLNFLTRASEYAEITEL